MLTQGLSTGFLMTLHRPPAGFRTEGPMPLRSDKKLTLGGRTFTGNDQRAVPRPVEGRVQLCQNLFRAADDIGADWRERIGHIKHG